MILPKINKNNPTEVETRIKELEHFDLCSMGKSELAKILFNSLNIPTHVYPQKKGKSVFRGQVNENNIPFDTISRISYNPNPSTQLGRANIVGESVFYASSSLDIAAIEACQDDLRNTSKRVFYVTIGEWQILKDLKINVFCHSEKAQKSGTDLEVASKSIDEMMRENRTEEEYKAFLLESRFFSDQFAKSKIKCNNDYIFSALCASQLFNNPSSSIDGIFYPSVAYKYMGFNVAYKNMLIDDNNIQIFKVYFLKLIFGALESYPKIKKLNQSVEFEKNIIKWGE